MAIADTARALIEPLTDSLRLELVEVEHAGGLLRVTLDREGGIDLEAISAASEAISDLLDRHDPIPSRYTLEVSSPGLERPLRTPAHFQRFVGSVVNIKTHAGVEGERRLQGVLAAADDAGVEVDGRRISYGDIERARTVFEWGPPPRPAKPSSGKSPKSKKATTP